MSSYNNIFVDVLKKEAGFQKMPGDPGNYCGGKLIGTKWGIGALAYKQAYGSCPTEAAMRGLTIDQAKFIWKKVIWDNIKGDQLKSEGVAAMILDATGGGKNGYLHTRMAINQTLGRTVVPETTVMNLSTAEVSLINHCDQLTWFKNFYNIRKFYFNNHPNRQYVNGWINRLNKTYGKYIASVSVKKSLPLDFNTSFLDTIPY